MPETSTGPLLPGGSSTGQIVADPNFTFHPGTEFWLELYGGATDVSAAASGIVNTFAIYESGERDRVFITVNGRRVEGQRLRISSWTPTTVATIQRLVGAYPVASFLYINATPLTGTPQAVVDAAENTVNLIADAASDLGRGAKSTFDLIAILPWLLVGLIVVIAFKGGGIGKGGVQIK